MGRFTLDRYNSLQLVAGRFGYQLLYPGNDFIEGLTEETFLKAVVFWERSVNHFLGTGEKLIKA